MCTSLYNSLTCRLCGDFNAKGVDIFDEESKLHLSINKHLSIKVKDDGILPKTICPGCHIHLQDLLIFVDLIVRGQKKIKQLRIEEIARQSDSAAQASLIGVQQESRGNEETPPVKRKRGRPRKVVPTNVEPPPQKVDEEPSQAQSRSARQRKQPSRFQECLIDNDLEKVLNEPTQGQGEETLKTLMPDLIGFLEDAEGAILGEVKYQASESKTRTLIICVYCGTKFKSILTFVKHKVTKTCGINCHSCKDSFGSKEALAQHQMAAGHSQSDWVCEVCLCACLTAAELADHLAESHPPTECPFCNTTSHFRSTRDLEHHVSNRHKGQAFTYTCEHCEAKFDNYKDSVVHGKKFHFNYFYKCRFCDKRFAGRQVLAKHIPMHLLSRPFKCEQCGRDFKTYSNLCAHIQTHVNTFTCETCNAKFNRKWSLQQHIKLHEGDKPYQCNVCFKTFLQKGNLKEHMRIHTGERPFGCDTCFQKFKTSSQLATHRLTHFAVRSYACDYCPKKFIHKDIWLAHIRRHQGNKPFACSVCDKRFPEAWSLRKHFRVHTGEKPYRCAHCQEVFSDCSNLIKHRKKFHKETLQEDSVLYLDLHQLTNDQGLIDMRLEEEGIILEEAGATREATLESLGLTIVQQPQLQEIKEIQGLEDLSGKIVTDEEGIPLKITMTDGTQLQVMTTDGQTLQVITNDGMSIPVKLTNSLDLQNIPTALADDPLTDEVSGGALSVLPRLTDEYSVQFVDDSHTLLTTSSFSDPSFKWDLTS